MAAYDLAGKVFFITGGAGDIGRSITEGVLDKKSKVRQFADIDLNYDEKIEHIQKSPFFTNFEIFSITAYKITR